MDCGHLESSVLLVGAGRGNFEHVVEGGGHVVAEPVGLADVVEYH